MHFLTWVPPHPPGTCLDRAESGLQVQGRVKAQSCYLPIHYAEEGQGHGCSCPGVPALLGQDQVQCLHRGRSRPALWNCSANNAGLCLLLPLGLCASSRESREPVCEDLWAPQPLEASQLHNGSHRPYINKTKMNTLCASKPRTLTLNFT